MNSIDHLMASSAVTATEASVELQRNLETFRTRLPKLLAEHEGHYVVIALGEIAQVVETYEAAVTYGYRTFPSASANYLIQKIALIPEHADIRMACRAA